MESCITPASVVITGLLFTPFILSSCGDQKLNNRTRGGTGSVLADISTVESTDRERDDLRYLLNCEGGAEIAGEVASDGANLVTFRDQNLRNGLTCNMEVRAKAEENLLWLTTPQTPGLFYASTKGTVESGRLQVKLYKVYREQDQEVEGEVAVTVDDGGLCQDFSLESGECLDDDEDETAFGIMLTEADDRLIVESVADGSLGANAGFIAGDVILSCEDVLPKTQEEFVNTLTTALASKDKAWVSILRRDESKLLWLNQGGGDG